MGISLRGIKMEAGFRTAGEAEAGGEEQGVAAVEVEVDTEAGAIRRLSHRPSHLWLYTRRRTTSGFRSNVPRRFFYFIL